MAGIELATGYVNLVVSTRGLGRDVGRQFGAAERQAGRSGKAAGAKFSGGVGSAVKKLGAVMAGAFAVQQVGSFFKEAVGGASDLSEQGTKLNQIFGKDGSAALQQFAAKGAKALGQSKLEVLEAAGTFGVYGKAAGLSGKANAKFASGFAGLATDLASFHNADPSAVVDALGSALRGEAEPMRQFGVLLDDASLRNEALKQGLIKTTKQALTPQQKVLAAQALIYAQTKDAQGDFAKTSGGLANQQRILSASVVDLRNKMGEKLLPIVTKVVSFFVKAVPKVEAFGKGVAGIFSILAKGNFKGAAETFGFAEDSGFVDFLFNLRDGFLKVRDAVAGFVAAFKADGGPSRIKAVLGEVSTFVRTKVVPAFLGIVSAVRGFVAVALPIVKQFVTGMRARIEPLMPQIRAIFQTIGSIITAAMGLIKAVIERVTKIIGFIWSRWGSDIMDFIAMIWKNVLKIIGGALKVIQGIIKTVTSIIKGDWSGAWEGIKTILSGAWDAIKGIISGALGIIKGVLKAAWAVIKTIFSSAWDGIKSIMQAAIRTVVMKFLGMVETIIKGAAKAFGWVPGLGGKLKSAATEFGKFKDRVNKALGGVNDKTVNVGIKFKAGTKLAYDARHQGIANGGLVKRAAGGVIPGPYRGPKADNVLGISDFGVPTAWVNPDEFITNVAATRKMQRNHPGVLEHINATGTLPGYASGGFTVRTGLPSRRVVDDSVATEVLNTVGRSAKMLQDAMGVGIGSKAFGWRQLWSIVHSLIPGIRLTSAYRPGAITALGNKSLHGMGRAIDLAPPSMAAFNTIKGAFPNATQLFYGPADGRTLLRGKPWRMDPVTKRNHYDHIHLAMANGGLVPKPLLFDRGGVLPTGTSLVHNATGAPEPLARVGMKGNTTVQLMVGSKQLAEVVIDEMGNVLSGGRTSVGLS